MSLCVWTYAPAIHYTGTCIKEAYPAGLTLPLDPRIAGINFKALEGSRLTSICSFSFRGGLLQEQVPSERHLQRQHRGEQDCGVRVRNDGLPRPLQKHLFQVMASFESDHILCFADIFGDQTTCLCFPNNFLWSGDKKCVRQACDHRCWVILDLNRVKEHLTNYQIEILSHLAGGRVFGSIY